MWARDQFEVPHVRQGDFTGILWQRCQFHLQQNASRYVPRKKQHPGGTDFSQAVLLVEISEVRLDEDHRANVTVGNPLYHSQLAFQGNAITGAFCNEIINSVDKTGNRQCQKDRKDNLAVLSQNIIHQ